MLTLSCPRCSSAELYAAENNVVHAVVLGARGSSVICAPEGFRHLGQEWLLWCGHCQFQWRPPLHIAVEWPTPGVDDKN